MHLYFNVDGIVSAKVSAGTWGENMVGELAEYIKDEMGNFSGFTRRGLYRMKQFYEVYSSSGFFTAIATQLNAYLNTGKDVIVSALPTQLRKNKTKEKMSASPTQIDHLFILKEKFISQILSRVSWTNHLEILPQTKSAEEKFFYLLHCIKEKWSMRDLRRQLSSGYFERAMLSDKKVPTALAQLPQTIFKDPYVFEFLDFPDGHSEKDLEKAFT